MANDLELQRVSSFAEFERLGQARALDHRRRVAVERELIGAGERFSVPGTCRPCAREVAFQVDFLYAPPAAPGQPRVPHWRERLLCPKCGLNNRLRASVHLFQHLGAPGRDDRIYVTEQTTPFFDWMQAHYTHVVGSEYLGDDVKGGSLNRRGLRHEDLTALSFDSEALDHVLTFDVLEHVPDYERGLAEIARVLRPGGQLLVTVPFTAGERNTVRARLRDDGTVEHLLPPEYHGDPVRTEGVLCYYHFGWELLEALRAVGLVDVEAVYYWSRRFGYFGAGQVFRARKPGGGPGSDGPGPGDGEAG